MLQQKFFLKIVALTALFVPAVAMSQSIGACFGFTNCTENKYAITGSTSAELIKQMNVLGPGNGWGQLRANFTDADTIPYEQNADGKFAIVSAAVEPSFTITLPDWSGYTSASACLKLSWDAMYSSLVNHEKQHAKISVKYAQKMQAAALAIPPSDSVKTLKAAVSTKLNILLVEHSSMQDLFDRQTNHGASDPLDPIILKSC